MIHPLFHVHAQHWMLCTKPLQPLYMNIRCMIVPTGNNKYVVAALAILLCTAISVINSVHSVDRTAGCKNELDTIEMIIPLHHPPAVKI